MRALVILLLAGSLGLSGWSQPPQALKDFVKSFERASKSNHCGDFLPFFDEAYIQANHGDFKHGNPKQFVCTFFTGNIAGSSRASISKKLYEIKKTKVKLYHRLPDGAWVAAIQVFNHDGSRYVIDARIIPRRNTGQTYYAYGFSRTSQ